MFLCGMNLWRDLWLDNGWVWVCMGGEMGYLQGIAAIGWVGYYPMTWLGFYDVRWISWEQKYAKLVKEDTYCMKKM